MKIGILQCGTAPADLEARFGTYAAMMRQMLGPDRDYMVHDVTAGDMPADVAAAGAYIVTGSAAGVYDDLPWIPTLMRFLQDARHKTKLVGICFGHQAMAEAFGGTVAKSEKGWGVGLHRYDVRDPSAWMDDVPQVAIPDSHHDPVVRRSTDARIISSSDFTPHAALDYGDTISFQYHPEFGADFAKALIERRRERLGPLADRAPASLEQPDDRPRVASWIGRFLEP